MRREQVLVTPGFTWVRVRSLTSQSHLQRNAGVTSSVAAVAFKARGQQNKPKAPVWFLPAHHLLSGAHLFWAIRKGTYQHLPRSLCLPFETGFDITDSHIAVFLEGGGTGIESVKCVLSLRTQHLPRDNRFIQRGGGTGQKCSEVPAEGGREG